MMRGGRKRAETPFVATEPDSPPVTSVEPEPPVEIAAEPDPSRDMPDEPDRRQPSELHLVTWEELSTLDRWTMERRCRALVSPLYLGDHQAICRILGRYKFYVDTRDVGFGAHILLDGFWEGWITHFLARQIKPGMAVVDVGANHGYYTMMFADLVGQHGRVCAVEPNPDLCKLLRRSVLLNGFKYRVDIHQCAAIDREVERMDFYIPAGEPKNGSLIPDLGGVPSELAHHVSGKPLSTLLADWPRVDFIKMDVEGAEEAALKGLMPIVERDRPKLLLEFKALRCSDATAFLKILRRLYRNMDYVDEDCAAHRVELKDLLNTDRGDWMLYCHPDEFDRSN
jgi:FkbM family methyltransferase